MGQLQITERDRHILAFAAEHRFVLAAQAALLLAIGEARATTRLRALADAGYLQSARPLREEPAWHQVTRDGLRVTGSGLALPKRVDLSEYRHDAGLAWLWVGAQRGMFGPLREIVGERRMRSEDQRARAADDDVTAHGVRIGGFGRDGRPRLHHPDLVLVAESGHRVAIELELTTKSARRRENILGAYAADRRIDAVVYLVDHPSRRRAIERSIQRVGVADLVRVEQVRLDHDVARPGQAPARARRRATPSAEAGR